MHNLHPVLLHFFFLGVYSLLQGGCSGATTRSPADSAANPGGGDVQAVVREDQFQNAVSIIRTLNQRIEFIPFGYAVDGCYARSLYMSMTLSANGIPSSSYFVGGNLQARTQAGQQVNWGYHVAPLLYVQSRNAYYVLDPSLEPTTGVLSSQTWLSRMNVNQTNPATWQLLVPGSLYPFNSGEVPSQFQNKMVSKIEEMPPYQLADIRSACGTLYNYLGHERNPAAEVAQKRRELEHQTVLLIGALHSQGRLQGYAPGTPIYCGDRFLGTSAPQSGALSARSGSTQPQQSTSIFNSIVPYSSSTSAESPSVTAGATVQIAVASPVTSAPRPSAQSREGQCTITALGRTNCCPTAWHWVQYTGESYKRCIPDSCQGFYNRETYQCE